QSGRSSSALSNSERRISSSPSNVASQILLLPSINIPGINQKISNNKIDPQIYFQVVQASQSQQQTLLGLWCMCASFVSVNNSKENQPLLFIGQLEETSTSRDKTTEKRTFLLFPDTFGTFIMRIISSDAYNEIKSRFCTKKEQQSVIGGSSIEIGNVIAIGASSQKQQDVTKQQYEKFVTVPYVSVQKQNLSQNVQNKEKRIIKGKVNKNIGKSAMEKDPDSPQHEAKDSINSKKQALQEKRKQLSHQFIELNLRDARHLHLELSQIDKEKRHLVIDEKLQQEHVELYQDYQRMRSASPSLASVYIPYSPGQTPRASISPAPSIVYNYETPPFTPKVGFQQQEQSNVFNRMDSPQLIQRGQTDGVAEGVGQQLEFEVMEDKNIQLIFFHRQHQQGSQDTGQMANPLQMSGVVINRLHNLNDWQDQ
ncbi:MAG: hypothetical protein EZS28_038390, partial [Streblomastix strix]